MHPILSKTFGGLSRAYYLRQFLFGAVFPVIVILMAISRGSAVPLNMALYLSVNTALYPYARFVYEGIVSYVMGSNMFIVNASLMLIAKMITIILCWTFAIFIAPAGLAYLYFHHTRNENRLHD